MSNDLYPPVDETTFSDGNHYIGYFDREIMLTTGLKKEQVYGVFKLISHESYEWIAISVDGVWVQPHPTYASPYIMGIEKLKSALRIGIK